VKSDGDVLQLQFDANALKHHPVMTLDLQDEVKRQADAGLRLELVS
jgi:hypothetical protein